MSGLVVSLVVRAHVYLMCLHALLGVLIEQDSSRPLSVLVGYTNQGHVSTKTSRNRTRGGVEKRRVKQRNHRGFGCKGKVSGLSS